MNAGYLFKFRKCLAIFWVCMGLISFARFAGADPLLAESIAALRVSVGGAEPARFTDVNGDGRLGVPEAIWALWKMAQWIREQGVGPRVRNAGLRTADSCDQLLARFREKAAAEMNAALDKNLEQAIEWGGCPPPYYGYWEDEMVDGGTGNAPPPPASAPKDAADQYSETNLQVAGVDEADFIKNNGAYIYMLADGRFQIIDAWPPENASVISDFGIEGIPRKMFVALDHAFIYSSLDRIEPPGDPSIPPFFAYEPDGEYQEETYGYGGDFTGDGRELKITVIEIQDPRAPRLRRELYFSGSLLNARRIDAAVHSALIFPRPHIRGLAYWPGPLQSCPVHDWWYYPEAEAPTVPQYSEAELRDMFETLREQNLETIENAQLKDCLPWFQDIRYDADGNGRTWEGTVGDCQGYFLSEQDAGDYFLSLISTDMAGKQDLSAQTVIGQPGPVYGSADAFYMAARHSRFMAPDAWLFPPEAEIAEATVIHKFDLEADPPQSSYSGSGAVKGHVLNQFSMDQHQGFFRIATTTAGNWNQETHSTVSVLRDNGDKLTPVGQIDDIAPTEDIRSARFDRDRGYVVTFKKTDPLFVLDLSQPYAPRIGGELKIPGFSTYIHRMDESHLLTIGYDTQDADRFAWFQGIRLQLFDVADMRDPRLLHKAIIGTRGSTSDAATNHLAFNYFAPRDLLALPMVVCQGGEGGSYGESMTFSGLMVYQVTAEQGFDYLGGIPHAPPRENAQDLCANWWTHSHSQVKRSVIMEDYLFSVSEDTIKVSHLSDLKNPLVTLELAE